MTGDLVTIQFTSLTPSTTFGDFLMMIFFDDFLMIVLKILQNRTFHLSGAKSVNYCMFFFVVVAVPRYTIARAIKKKEIMIGFMVRG